MTGRTLVIKIGGRSATPPLLPSFFRQVAQAVAKGWRVSIVHGGGDVVSDLSRKLGIEPKFENGIRITSEAEMNLVDMGLAGAVNTGMVRMAAQMGLKAVGISGAASEMYRGEPISTGATHTGRVTTTTAGLAEDLMNLDYLPICAPVSSTNDGYPLNINADEAALALAQGLKADTLLFISDIPGVLIDDQVVSQLVPTQAEEHIASGAISGGMIPKVRSSFAGLTGGIGRVIIGQLSESSTLQQLLSARRGTTMGLEGECNG